jgi:hypothetical protein
LISGVIKGHPFHLIITHIISLPFLNEVNHPSTDILIERFSFSLATTYRVDGFNIVLGSRINDRSDVQVSTHW